MGRNLGHQLLNQRLHRLINYSDDLEIKSKEDYFFKRGLEYAIAKLEDRPVTYPTYYEKSKLKDLIAVFKKRNNKEEL
ncbi:hypothetical protein ACIQXQ_20065 [Peribacillus sp. NPDC097198]|uniref:hypothetical protein n=1 Tax=Peribacillus sp. NPDC097198 TaxID=3364397 RepID=UPI0038125ADA